VIAPGERLNAFRAFCAVLSLPDVPVQPEVASHFMPDVVMMTDETSAIGAPISGGEFAALESRAMHATIWTVISYGATQALRLGNSMILTRLLLPQAFGEMTLVMTLIIGMTMLSDIGLEPSVIQSPRGDEPEFLNTAWTLQAIRGGFLWAIALLLAWPAARFYNDPRLLYVLPVLALSTLLTGMNSTNLLSQSRHMGVRRLFAVDISTQLVGLVVTVAWALHWPSVWALVAGNLVSNLYKVVISHQPRCMPGIRNRFFWDRSCLTEIIHFGKWIFLATAFWFFALNSDKLILGKLVPLSVLGVYGIAFQLSDIPRQIINAFSIKVGYPFISRMVHLPMAEFRARFLRYRSYALMVGGVLLSLMVTWGGWAELKIYPARYADAHWMIPILAVGLWHTLLYQTLGPALLSLGKSKYGAFGNGAYCVTILIGIPTAFHFWGLLGAVIAVAAGDFPLYLVTAFGATREGVRPVRQDLLLTCGFLALLAIEFALRHGLR
jgi:O-antigen/teichoic acid export membrane protein